MNARIVSINLSHGGVPKRPVERADVQPLGIVGDAQRHRRFHGGPDRALCLYSMEAIDALRAEGHPIEPGSTGENVTIAGLVWAAIAPGVRLSLGDVEVEITGYANPCHQIQPSFLDGDSRRIDQRRHPGWSRVYCRILRAGVLRRGDAVAVRAASA
jgi:MOSC domain-containing protein YiiM